MTARITADAKGLYVIAATPFHDDGRIDFESIDSLVDFYLACGVQGMTILGVMGEFQKLSESETIEVSQRYLKRTAGRVPIIVGVSNPGTNQLVKVARAVMEAGAAGVMAMPIRGLKTDQAVENYLRSILTALGPSIPVCVQDYPKLTDVSFGPDVFLRLVDEFPQIAMFKHEDMPGLAKLSVIRKACDGKSRRYIPILCGNGGIHLPQEYRRGADGAMTGFAFPDMMVRMHALFAAGKADEAEDLYDLYLPVPLPGLAERDEAVPRLAEALLQALAQRARVHVIGRVRGAVEHDPRLPLAALGALQRRMERRQRAPARIDDRHRGPQRSLAGRCDRRRLSRARARRVARLGARPVGTRG
jgi:4-hydroxy-tetrahydrodipicolinate synthase